MYLNNRGSVPKDFAQTQMELGTIHEINFNNDLNK